MAAAGQEDVKPALERWSSNAVPAATLMITILNQVDGDKIQFKIKATTKLQKMFKSFRDSKGYTDEFAVKFLHPDGNYLRGDRTAEESGLEDGDELSAVLNQNGGVHDRAAQEVECKD